MTELRLVAERRPAPARVWERALDLVFPPRCVSCGAFRAFICDGCLASTISAEPPRCRICWMPLGQMSRDRTEVRACRRCYVVPPRFKAVRSAYIYQGAARDAVHALKFRGVSAIAPVMAALMAQTLVEWSPPVDCIVPVPLAGSRRRERGYNQSELLARDLSRLTAVPLERRALVRPRGASPQYRVPDREERRANVRDAFRPGKLIPRGGVLLVDDVVTTGATLDACSQVLLESGAGAVFALTFARED